MNLWPIRGAGSSGMREVRGLIMGQWQQHPNSRTIQIIGGAKLGLMNATATYAIQHSGIITFSIYECLSLSFILNETLNVASSSITDYCRFSEVSNLVQSIFRNSYHHIIIRSKFPLSREWRKHGLYFVMLHFYQLDHRAAALASFRLGQEKIGTIVISQSEGR